MENEDKLKVFAFRIAEDLKAKIVERAKIAGIPPSTFMRSALEEVTGYSMERLKNLFELARKKNQEMNKVFSLYLKMKTETESLENGIEFEKDKLRLLEIERENMIFRAEIEKETVGVR